MYKIKLSDEETKRIANGDVKLLLKRLKESDDKIIRDLKTKGSDTAYLCGASSVIDRLIKILEVSR